ncbi:MAG: DUF4105 domain-containing protein, partial [Bdellovibrionota bacterium]
MLAIDCHQLIRFGILLIATVEVLGLGTSRVQAAEAEANSQVSLAAWSERLAQWDAAHDLEWRRLLFYRSRWLRSASSVVDDPRFFLSESGQINPATEMRATLRAFFESTEAVGDESAYCRFPARVAFLNRRYPDLASAFPIPVQKCPKWDEFRNGLPAKRISLVFSSYFPNNAGSLFGHTLLRFHLQATGKERPEQALLDIGVNYAANVDTGNPLLYMFRGLTGGFQGSFSVMPYYMKIQEYNNAESRDLWEYELDLDTAEVQQILASLWEIGKINLRYWYLDENCALLILQLLETARTDVYLTDSLHAWVIPSDAARRVSQYGPTGFVKAVRFRPSNLLKYESRFNALSAGEATVLSQLIGISEGSNLEPTIQESLQRGEIAELSSQARVLDAAIEWVDFQTKAAGSEPGEKHLKLRNALLAKR